MFRGMTLWAFISAYRMPLSLTLTHNVFTRVMYGRLAFVNIVVAVRVYVCVCVRGGVGMCW